ncbi:MAG: hypothetical protein ACP5NZ_02115 [Nanobdellota archaeon]
MKKGEEISVVKRLGSAIYSKERFQGFLDELSKTPGNIIIDFDEVDFISKGCAELYLEFMEENKERVKAIKFTPGVSTMIKEVKFRT